MRSLDLLGGSVTVAGAHWSEITQHGVLTHRLTESCREILDERTATNETVPSGVRLEFMSDATKVILRGIPTRRRFTNQPRPRPSVADVVVNAQLVATADSDDGTIVTVDPTTFAVTEVEHGETSVYRFELPPGMKEIEIWLPHTGSFTIEQLLVDDDAIVETGEQSRKRWTHYGSSISQCTDAHSPARIWPAITAREAGFDLTNLALAGSCHLDQYVARQIRDAPADVITLKLGVNLVNMASLIERTFVPAFHGFIDTIRDGHEDTPIVVVSPIIFPRGENRPGPSVLTDEGTFDNIGDPDHIAMGALTVRRIRTLLADGVDVRRRNGDLRIWYLDGRTLFGGGDLGDLPDHLHPNGGGYERIGARFAAAVFGLDGLVPDLASARSVLEPSADG